jgi:CRISPR-associated endonuclease/helicase Cas3
LIDHSADVAAMLQGILTTQGTLARLQELSGTSVQSETTIAQLTVLAALHDFGKANRGFQARWEPHASPVGHVKEAMLAMADPLVWPRLVKALPLLDVDRWFGSGSLVMTIAHHGYPVGSSLERDDKKLWAVVNGKDPVAFLAPLGEAIRHWLPEAFAASSRVPIKPRGWHLLSGLLTLADWIASDETFFPLASIDEAEVGRARYEQSIALSRGILQKIGFDPRRPRRALTAPPNFTSISPYPPRPIQLAAGEVDDQARIVALEAETGSGKTEAALFRFARLFAAGKVDGLYFALPTRVAATALHARVRAAVTLLWPDASSRPAVVLAVPGQEIVSDVGLIPPAGGHDVWANELENREQVWAASRPKKYLAGTIAVGTIDQALLAIIKAKHAHLRLSCLTRLLLVVDEVHASDRYMEGLLGALLRFHRRAGGHALLLSATLGSRAREKLLGRDEPPPLTEAVAAPYPALSDDTQRVLRAYPWEGRVKSVKLTTSTEIGDPVAVARMALEAARTGAKVLVIRNLRRDAVATFNELRSIAPEAPIFSCHETKTLHHGRFAREDRPRLDAAIETSLGRSRPSGGLIVIGTQTLEQSLDISSDFMISDIAPADVLLQRLGRLHRHENERPLAFREPQATILVPLVMQAVIHRPVHGLGVGRNFAMPYPDVIAVEATLRLVVENPLWSIPAMNRTLVERVTHPEARAVLLDKLRSISSDWDAADRLADGRTFAHIGQATLAILRTDVPFDDPAACFSADDVAATRLGAKDLLIELPEPVQGPFGGGVSEFQIPVYWGIDPDGDISPQQVNANGGMVTFSIQQRLFRYDATGLAVARR